MTTLTTPVFYDAFFQEEHYSRVCGCTIPAMWKASVTSGIPEIDSPENYEYLERFGYPKCKVESFGDTKSEAIQGLGAQLKEMEYTGLLRQEGK